MDTRSDLSKRWFCDFRDREWKVSLLDGTIVRMGDQVQVKFDNGVFTGRVKQVAGFGMKETRPIISILFPGRSKGVKVHIDSVLKKC